MNSQTHRLVTRRASRRRRLLALVQIQRHQEGGRVKRPLPPRCLYEKLETEEGGEK